MYLSVLMRNNEFSYSSSCSRNGADLARYLSSRSGRACMGSYKYFRAPYVDTLVTCSKCDTVLSFPVCIDQVFFLMRNKFSSHQSAREITNLLEQLDG